LKKRPPDFAGRDRPLKKGAAGGEDVKIFGIVVKMYIQ